MFCARVRKCPKKVAARRSRDESRRAARAWAGRIAACLRAVFLRGVFGVALEAAFFFFLTVLDPVLVLDHSVSLTGLLPETTYHFRVLSRDGFGNFAMSGDFTFTTSGEPDGDAGFALNFAGTNDYVEIVDN